MIEAEWLASNAPTGMLRHIARRASLRKLQLYGCACCRRIWDLLTQDHWRAAVEVAERFADGDATVAELSQAHDAVGQDASVSVPRVDAETPVYALQWLTSRPEQQTPRCWVWHQLPLVESALNTDAYTRMAVAAQRRPKRRSPAPQPTDSRDECRAHAQLLRDIFGHLVRTVSLGPAGMVAADAGVVRFAQAVYAERAFERLPILADALEESGCADAEVLGHCRGPGTHVRGCWVVDLLLGKQ